MFCKNCQQKIPDDSTFCNNCGEKIQIKNSEENKFFEKKDKIIICIFVTMAICLIAFCSTMITSGNNKSKDRLNCISKLGEVYKNE